MRVERSVSLLVHRPEPSKTSPPSYSGPSTNPESPSSLLLSTQTVDLMPIFLLSQQNLARGLLGRLDVDQWFLFFLFSHLSVNKQDNSAGQEICTYLESALNGLTPRTHIVISNLLL